MRAVALRDSNFAGQACLHASGDNVGRAPASLDWDRVMWAPGALVRLPARGSHIWLTDAHLSEAKGWRDEGLRPVAWLLEPRELHPENYEYVLDHLGRFEAVVSHDREFLASVNAVDGGEFGHPSRGLFAPSGGTRIHPSDWGIPEKNRAVSIVASPKRSMEGHRLRHELINRVGSYKVGEDQLHPFGPEYIAGLDRKRDALLPYRFSVAIENCRRDYWFTEALIDCFLTGTVPIYWGCPSIAEFFNPAGMLIAEDLGDLVSLAEEVCRRGNELYEARTWEIRENFIRAHEYTLTEDWLFRQYPELCE